MPFSINWEFLARGRLGAKYMYGQVQEFKTEHLMVDVKMHECQTISKEWRMDNKEDETTAKKDEEDDDEDDFDEDDDQSETPQTKKKQPKMSNIAGLLCGMRDKLVKDEIPEFQKYLEKFMVFDEHSMMLDFLA